MTAAHTLAVTFSPGEFLILLLAVAVGGAAVGLSIVGWDRRNYSADVVEFPDPPSNVVERIPDHLTLPPVAAPSCGHDGCAAAADLYAERLPEAVGR